MMSCRVKSEQVVLNLLNIETNIIYTLYTNVENAEKARNDIYIWNKKEILLLIDLYKEHEALFTSDKMKRHLCWGQIAKEMVNEGYSISARKYCTKFQTLKIIYKQIKDHNNKSENSIKTWEYFDTMNELFGTKPWIEPISTASSDQTDKSTLSDENVQPAKLLGPTRKSKDKIHFPMSRQALLEYRKLHTAKKMDNIKKKWIY